MVLRLLLLLMIVLLPLQVSAQEESVFIYDDKGKRDPLWRLVSPSGAIINYEKELLLSDMVLEGILVEPDGNNVAIINGMIVKKNDKIGMFTVKEVEPRTVVLQKGLDKFTLNLKKED